MNQIGMLYHRKLSMDCKHVYMRTCQFCEKTYSFHFHAGLHVHCVMGLYRSQYGPNTCVGVASTGHP